jgi:hypothetical protein
MTFLFSRPSLALCVALCLSAAVPRVLRASEESRVQTALSTPNGEIPDRDKEFVEGVVDRVITQIQQLVAGTPKPEDFDPIIHKLDEMMPLNLRGARSANPNPTYFKLASAKEFAARYQDYLAGAEHENYAKAAQSISSLNQEESEMYPIIARSQLVALEEQVMAREAVSRQAIVDGFALRVVDTADKAKTAADFDALYNEIGAAQQQDANLDNELAQNLAQLRRCVSLWQDYLLQLGPEPERAAKTLASLWQNSNGMPAAFRAQISKRLPQEQQPVRRPAEPSPTTTAATLPDPEGLRPENLRYYSVRLDMNRLGVLNTQEISSAERVITELSSAYNGLVNGEPQRVFELAYNLSGPVGAYEGPIAKVKEQLLTRALLARFPDAGVTAVPGEKAVDLAKRMVAARVGNRQWQRAIDTLATLDVMGRRAEYVPDTAAIQTFLTGTHQEVAEEYALATSSYLQSLASTGQFTPVDAIAERLKAIKAEHPAEFAEGHLAYTHGSVAKAAQQALAMSYSAVGRAAQQQAIERLKAQVTPTPRPTSQP